MDGSKYPAMCHYNKGIVEKKLPTRNGLKNASLKLKIFFTVMNSDRISMVTFFHRIIIWFMLKGILNII